MSNAPSLCRTALGRPMKEEGEALITGPQIRAARGFLAWDRRDLAKKAVVTIYTVERIETGAEIVRHRDAHRVSRQSARPKKRPRIRSRSRLLYSACVVTERKRQSARPKNKPTDETDREEFRPDNPEAGAAIENRLRKRYEMGRG